MSVAARRITRKVATRPAPRTVQVKGTGDYADWECTVRADFPARIVGDLESAKVDRIIAAFDSIIVDHNFPDSAGDLAVTMADVDPYDGLLTMAGLAFDAIGKLPPR